MNEAKSFFLDTKHLYVPLAVVITLCGSLYWVGYQWASINMRLGSIETIVKENKNTSGELMKILNDHEKRITTIESKL